MNKIYKVIWSKTRNCYVAVAEFVKRNGKGSSLNRRHIAAALAAVAICAAPAGALANSGGSVDVSGSYIGDAPDYKVVIDSDTNGWVYGRYESGDTTATGASVTVTSGTVGKEPSFIEVYGGYSFYGNAANNTVTISGGTVGGEVYGGYSDFGNAEKNTVFISGGKVNSVRGGYSRSNSDTATASDNEVTISGGSVGTVYGGYSFYGNAANNTVILSKEKEAPVLNGTLFGGYGNRTISNNTLQVEAVGLSAPEIRKFDNYRFVLPKDIKAGDTRA